MICIGLASTKNFLCHVAWLGGCTSEFTAAAAAAWCESALTICKSAGGTTEENKPRNKERWAFSTPGEWVRCRAQYSANLFSSWAL